MKARIVILAIAVMVLLLSACVPIDSEVAGGSVDVTRSFTFFSASATTSIADDITGRLKVSSSNASELGYQITVYGHNSTDFIVEEMVMQNDTANNTVAGLFTHIDRLVLNASQPGTITAYDNVTSAVLAVFVPGETVAYNGARYDGSEWVPPLFNGNGSSVDVRKVDEIVLWNDCTAVNNSALVNITWSYWVSPDNSKWFSGAVSIPSCGGAVGVATEITDNGVAYIKLGVNNADIRANQVYTKLVYR